jgi:hypothetical protein
MGTDANILLTDYGEPQLAVDDMLALSTTPCRWNVAVR